MIWRISVMSVKEVIKFRLVTFLGCFKNTKLIVSSNHYLFINVDWVKWSKSYSECTILRQHIIMEYGYFLFIDVIYSTENKGSELDLVAWLSLNSL